MLIRSAWIALIGGGLLCYAIFAQSLPTQDQQQRTWISVVSSQESQPSTTDLATTITNLVDDETVDSLPANNTRTLALMASSAAPELTETGADSRVTIATSQQTNPIQVNPIHLVSFSTGPVDNEANTERDANSWPIAETLIEQIKQLDNVPEIQGWSQQTIVLLEALSEASPSSRELENCLGHLELQLAAVPKLVAAVERQGQTSVESRYAHCEVSRLAYRLQRRIAIWKTLHRNVGHPGAPAKGVFHSFGSGSAINSASISRIDFGNLDPNWVEYLKLKELKSAFGSLNPDAAEHKKVARSVLARIYSSVLKPEQAAYVNQVIDPMLISSLKEHATGEFAAPELLKRIEKYESQSSGLAGYYLNDQYQNLLWSNNPQDQALAAEIQTHYRNANFRFVVSKRLLNRMVPELPSTASPVDANIKGAQVSGQSHVSNKLRIELMPNASEIQLLLATTGDVQSDTIAKTKSFRIQNFGKAKFQVVQQINISPQGIDSSSSPQALSQANQYVVGVESKMDNLPVVGWMARKLAAKKLREEAPETNRLFKRTVESSAVKQMRQKVTDQLARFRHSAYTNLFQPLFEMDLEPRSVQMSSTADQIVMRYRLAGRDQMAANTSRPRDSGDSLLSFQVHQSAINNLIARIGISGNQFTIEELKEHLRGVAGIDHVNLSDEGSDQHAEIGFAYLDPIHIDFQDDRLNITLNLRSLKIGESGKTWKNISLTASYSFALDGMGIQLQQDDDGTRIKGRRLRFSDKAAISAVMKVLFKQQYSMDSLPRRIQETINAQSKIDQQSLEISQLVASDGWFALSVDDRKTTTARAQHQGQLRTGSLRNLIQRR